MDLRLKIVPDKRAPVDLAMKFPAQPRLVANVWVALQNQDELSLQIDGVAFSFYPFETAKVHFDRTLRNVLSGDYRLVTWHRTQSGPPFRGELQKPGIEEWITVATWSNGMGLFAFPAVSRVRRERFLNQTQSPK